MNFLIFATIAVISAFIWFYMGNTNKKVRFDTESFWERERRANSMRKQPLDALLYITIPLEALPFIKDTEDEALKDCQNQILSLSGQKIVNLTGISNTDLKFQYGVANLNVLSDYDQNYTTLIRTLFSWGKTLYSLGLKEKAVRVLEFAVTCRADIKGCYLLLADLYEENQEYEKIEALIETAESLNSLMKDSIVGQLREKSIYTSSVHIEE
ncbi:MAG: hypothetical protein QM697_11730 [Lachnospiraceae bacterium]